MKTRQIHGLGLGEFLIFAPAKEMLKSAYFFSALEITCLLLHLNLVNYMYELDNLIIGRIV